MWSILQVHELCSIWKENLGESEGLAMKYDESMYFE